MKRRLDYDPRRNEIRSHRPDAPAAPLPETIRQFERENLISESAPPFGACFWLNEAQRERVRQLESKYNILVYHVIHSFTTIGEMESYLYVDSFLEMWGEDRDKLKGGEAFAYVYNCDDPSSPSLATSESA